MLGTTGGENTRQKCGEKVHERGVNWLSSIHSFPSTAKPKTDLSKFIFIYNCWIRLQAYSLNVIFPTICSSYVINAGVNKTEINLTLELALWIESCKPILILHQQNISCLLNLLSTQRTWARTCKNIFHISTVMIGTCYLHDPKSQSQHRFRRMILVVPMGLTFYKWSLGSTVRLQSICHPIWLA